MPWTPSYTEHQLRAAIESAENWREVMATLGRGYHGKTIATARRWAGTWGIATDHLTDRRGRARGHIRYTDADVRAAVEASLSWAESLRRIGLCPTGGNHLTLKKRCAELNISTAHFDPYAHARHRGRARRIPLAEILVERSTYSRSKLKQRLYDEGHKRPRCELCRQGEDWNGVRIALILDHINGVRDDNRLENLRIVCPNCAAGLDTHCGRKNPLADEYRACDVCGAEYRVKYPSHRFCTVQCGAEGRSNPLRGVAQRHRRKVERPSLAQLQKDLSEMSFVAAGRKYGVSDNAVRKWLVWYEHEAERERGEAT
jgi:hypothetical protein